MEAGESKTTDGIFTIFKGFILLCMALVMSLLLSKANVQAASQKTLKTDITYTKYDITGDGKADTIRLTPIRWNENYTDSEYKSLKIRVNGVLAYTFKSNEVYDNKVYDFYTYGFSAKLITLDNKKTFLYVEGYCDNYDTVSCLLQYNSKTKKFRQIAYFNDVFGNPGHINTSIKSVKGNTVVIHVYYQSNTIAGIMVDITYKYKSGTLKQENPLKIQNMPFGRTLTANRKFTVYKTIACKTKSFTVKSGEKVYFLKVYLKNGKIYYKVRVNGKTGWIAEKTKYQSKFFKEIEFYG